MLYAIDARRPDIAEDAFVADNASVIGSVRLAPGSSVWFNCVLRGDHDDIVVGENSNVQDGAVLHTDPGIKLSIGRGCTIGHLAMLHGCTLGDFVLVGIGAVILNHAQIGAESIVGAGSLVPERKIFPAGVLLMGTPAKVVRELSPQERQTVRLNGQHYVDNARRYRRGLLPLRQG